MSEARRHQASSVFSNHARFESDDEISAFGYPKINHGWIECISTSFPGQTYYFNVDTCCSTWNRPVSRFVPTRFARPVKLKSEEDSLDDASIAVSDIEDENDYDEYDEYEEKIDPDLPPDADDVKPPTFTSRNPKESRATKIYAEVLFKLYHCYGDEWNDDEIEDVAPLDCETVDDDSYENFAPNLLETCYSSDSDSESTGSGSGTTTEGTKTSETSEETKTSETSEETKSSKTLEETTSSETSIDTKNLNRDSSIDIPKDEKDEFGEFDCPKILDENSDSEIKNEEDSLSVSASSVEDSDVGSRVIGLSSDDEEDDEEEENTANERLFSLPTLKTIEFADLLRPRKLRKKSKKRKASTVNDETSQKTRANKMIKIVCEVNGVTTVNYDYFTPELPTGVKMSNLSDSESSSCYDAWYGQESKNANNNDRYETSAEVTKSVDFLNDSVDLSEPDLSDSSSSSESSVKSTRTKANEILRVPNDLQRNNGIKANDSSSSASSSESSVKSTRTKAKEIMRVPNDLQRNNGIKANDSSSSSSSSESSWIYSGDSSDDDN